MVYYNDKIMTKSIEIHNHQIFNRQSNLRKSIYLVNNHPINFSLKILHLLSYHLIFIIKTTITLLAMTKKDTKSQNKKRKNQQIDKDKMKQVLETLAANKVKNQKITPDLKSITSLNKVHAEQKKEKKLNSERKKSRNLDIDEQDKMGEPKVEQRMEEEPINTQNKINIFAMNEYVSEKPVIVKQQVEKEDTQLDLESQARKIMGENWNTEKFGQKPLKKIDEDNKMIPEEEEENQKKIAHPNIQIPEGNFKIQRTAQIEQIREKLPIYMKQQEIIESINNNLVTLICGQTGSGKSTQLPQFLAEKNYQSLGKIAITQPRRLATTSLARRVSYQTNFKLGAQIGYQVRHERKQSQKTFIKFMTDGILLKEMSSDPMLLEYGVIIIDQAHQRKINTDILVGLLSRLILVRYKLSQEGKCLPLRLVIMSATLRVQDFKNKILFDFQIPILNVESKMYPVTIFHEKKTPDNYVDCAVKKCVKIHKQLPPGDVLVFLTGKDQIHEMCIKLEHQLEKINFEDDLSDAEDENQQKIEGQHIAQEGNMKHHNYFIYRLYSSLPTQEQQKIFETPPQGCRKFIISTNIAETSITVPNIRYVIDSGQEKHRFFDGVWRWRKGWGSKAMAAQRSGRAGRTAHGYCYRLYSSALYANIMQEYPEPQISKQPLQSVILQIKAIGFNDVFAFPFPTQPEIKSILNGLEGLRKVEAVNGDFTGELDETKITELGKVISFIPLAPRLAKMLLVGRMKHIENYVLLICILLTVQQIFSVKSASYPEYYDQQQIHFKIDEKKTEQNQFVQNYQKYIEKRYGDIFTALNIVGELMTHLIKELNNKTNKRKTDYDVASLIKQECTRLHLNQNVIRQFYYNCDQICEIYETLTSNKIELGQYSSPSKGQILQILDILLMAFPQNICKHEKNNQYKNKFSEKVYIHRLSPLYKLQHQFVGCVDFFSNAGNRKYLRYPFCISNQPLMVTYGSINKPHAYAWKDDRIVGVANGNLYGWEIPNLTVDKIEGEMQYFQMAKFLLQGKIFPQFKVLQEKKMLNSPVSIIKPDNLQEKVQTLVYAFRIRNINCKSQIVQTMKSDAHFLEKELGMWMNAKNPSGVYKMLREKVVK